MELFKEYTDLVELYDNDPSHPQTQNELINICYLPEFYSRFGLNTDKQKLALSSKHLYTMQVSKDVGYYAEGHSTHYHNLKKKIMLKFPELLITPDFVFYDQSYNDLKEDSLPSSLVAVLPQRFYKINKKTKESFKEVLVAYIEEPMNPSDKTSILTTSFSKHDVERYINRLLKLNRLLYISEDFLNEKKSLSTVYPGIQFTNIATHSNGETRNNMAFLGSLNNNIRQYRENVNLKRMDVSGLYLEHIPENERTKIVCNRAFANNSYAVNYFPEPLREQTYKTKVFETLDKKTIQTIPNDLFIPSLQYFLQNTEQCGHQSKIVYNTLKKRFSENQKDILSQAVNPEKEPDEKEIVKTFETWSEGNLYERLKASPIPQNIQSISDSVLSFENNKSDILDIIGKQFETDSSGKPTLNGMKQLSKAMEIYSDKHYETARYLFIKDGVITRHIAVTSQTPASTIIKPDERFLYQLKNYAEETGSKIVFLHNHPSGYVVPSEADINLTEYLTNFFEEQNGENSFSGHIILDHGTYGLYESENRSWNALINDEIKPLSEVKKNYKIQLTEHKKKADFNRDYTITERSLKELSEYAKACDNGEVWNKKDWIPAFLLTGNGIVTSLEYINTLELQNEDSLSEKLKFLGRKYGSESIIMLPSDKQQFLMCERYAQDTGKVKDVFLQNSDGTFEVSDYRNGNIFNDLRVDEIKLEDTMTKNDAVLQKIEKEQKLRNENDSIYNESVNKNINNHKENKTMNKKTIKAFDIYSELKELIGDNNYEALKFATMDYLYNRGIDDAAGYEDSVERNKARFMELPTNIQNVMEKYDDYKIDFDDKALAIKIAGTRNGNLDKAKAQKDEEIANRNYIRESLNLSALNERPMDISVEPEQAEIIENPMEISEVTTEPDPNDSVTSDENGTQLNKILKKLEEKEKIIEKLQKQNQIIMEQNQVNSQKLAALEQQIKAPKEAQEKSANDSMGQDYNNFSSVKHQNLTNQDGFGRDTAYKKNQKVPTFGILQDDGSHQLIKNAVFSKLLVDEENPANNKIELLVLKENGKQETFQIEEKLYNDIINNVQEFEQRKQGQSKDSWDWMMVHMDYAEKMGTDDNSFRLNTADNFIHNFRVHCMRDEAHNPEQALKVAGIMFDRMAKREKERFLKMRKQWDKRAKIDGGPTFDEHLIKQFNEFHPKKDINIEQIKGYHFDAEEAVDKQNLMYESLRSGKIEGTNTNIGDTISFAMKYKDTFSGKHLKTPKEDWKIVEVSKCLSGDRALIYNEKSKAYYKIPLENLVEQIRKNERLQTKEEKKAIMQDHKNFGYDGPER